MASAIGDGAQSPAPTSVEVAPLAAVVSAIEDPMVRLTRQLVIWTRVMALAAALTLVASWFQWSAMNGQLEEMKSSSKETENLIDAARKQAAATNGLEAAGKAQAAAATAQATAMDRLKSAGEAQAKATQNLAIAGTAQADATKTLATNSANQIVALQTTAHASNEQARAALVASAATARLAQAGQSQADAVLQTAEAAREANAIARSSSAAADRPWLAIQAEGIGVPTAGGPWTVTAQLVNSGRSPALQVQVVVTSQLIGVPFSVAALPPCAEVCQTNVIFPGPASWGYRPTIKAEQMTPDVVADIKSGKTTVIVRSRIDYTDSSGNRHATVTCSYYDANAVGLTTCRGGNEAS